MYAYLCDVFIDDGNRFEISSQGELPSLYIHDAKAQFDFHNLTATKQFSTATMEYPFLGTEVLASVNDNDN